MPLTESAIKAAKPGPKRIKLPDGGGLYILLTPTGRRSWFLTYRHSGRSKTLPLGAFPAVSLTAARLAREQAKLALAKGHDPGAPDAPPPVPTAPPCRTLREAAEEWVKVAGAGWKESHRERVESRLRMNIFPMLGAKRLDDITPPDVLAAVRQVEARGAMDISRRTVRRWRRSTASPSRAAGRRTTRRPTCAAPSRSGLA